MNRLETVTPYNVLEVLACLGCIVCGERILEERNGQLCWRNGMGTAAVGQHVVPLCWQCLYELAKPGGWSALERAAAVLLAPPPV